MKTATLNAKLNFSNDIPETKSNIIDTLKRKNLYWVSQASGWSLYRNCKLTYYLILETIPLNKIFLWVPFRIVWIYLFSSLSHLP